MKLRVRIAYGICSYVVAFLLLLTPFFSEPKTQAAARIVPFLCGAFLLCGALLTDFEMGIARMMKFRNTVFLTVMGCICILLSVVVLSYGQTVWLIIILSSCQGSMSLMAYKTHSYTRADLA